MLQKLIVTSNSDRDVGVMRPISAVADKGSSHCRAPATGSQTESAAAPTSRQGCSLPATQPTIRAAHQPARLQILSRHQQLKSPALLLCSPDHPSTKLFAPCMIRKESKREKRNQTQKKNPSKAVRPPSSSPPCTLAQSTPRLMESI